MLEKFSRRMLLGSGLAVSGTALAHLATTGRAKPVMQSYSTPVPATEPPLSGQPAPAAAITSPRVIRPELLTAALDALHRHSGRIAQRDRIAIADFAAPSSERRFHFFNVENGDTQTLLEIGRAHV